MSPLVLAYCLLLLAGVIWIAYRVVAYMRAERERESRWIDMFEDEDFKTYLKKLSAERETGRDKPPGETRDVPSKRR